jgi:RHS repeat-associated protein
MDDEIKGVGNSVNYLFRMHDPRLGRWLSPDPKFALQPNWSPYKFGLNNPIIFVDPEGKTEFYSNGKWIGTDGVDNNLVAKVTDRKVRRAIIKSTIQGLNYEAQSINAAAESKNGMFLMNKDVLNYSNYMLKLSLTPYGQVGEYGNTMSKNGNSTFDENGRYPAINVFDKNSNKVGTITAEEADKMIQGERGSLGKIFGKKLNK